MNCKWAEGHLSACLDGTLDPAVRDEVTAHVEACAQCSGVLQEFRYFDGLVASLPRYEPPEDLRRRIFESPEFAAILRSLDEPDEAAAPARHPATSNPFARPRAITLDRGVRPAHDRVLTPLPLPSALDASNGDGGPDQPALGPDAAQPNRSGPSWSRVAISIAAAVVLLLGSGLLIQQALPHSTTTCRAPAICGPIGNKLVSPLAAGPRVIYERGGALWSAPEQGSGSAQQLTSTNVSVGAGWAVAPIQNAAGGDHVAYIDLKTGAVHVVRSDDQQDRIVGQTVARSGASASFWASAEGQAILAGLVWSPDGSQLAYLAGISGTSGTALVVVHGNGNGAAAMIQAAANASSAMAVWSPDGQRIAFVQTGASGQSVWDFNVATHQMRQLSANDGSAGSAATVRALGWLPQAMGPLVTWAVGDPAAGTYTDLFFRSAVQDGQPQRLTPVGASFTAADYSALSNSGTWLLGDGTALYAVSAHFPGVAQLVMVTGGVRAVSWAPNGTAAAFVSNAGDLWLWLPGAGFSKVTGGVVTQPGLAWAPDGSALAFVAGGQATIVRLSGDTLGASIALSGATGATAFAWAPDGQRLAVAAPTSVILVNADGTAPTAADTHSADGVVVWSVAR
jgi:dipeptidyl aminopeptidase/acylaminoacyl peptidase